MADLTPTRSLALALRDERRTMREGYAFLDEKCLLLAGAMLREVRRHRLLVVALTALQASAQAHLLAAIARHGLNGLQVQPARLSGQRIERRAHTLVGVPLLDVALAGPRPVAPAAVNPSPEVAALRRAFGDIADQLAQIAAASSNLARLHAEYRRTVRRVRALQDVLLPEVEATLAGIEAALDELEQDEFAFVRRAARQNGAGGIAA